MQSNAREIYYRIFLAEKKNLYKDRNSEEKAQYLEMYFVCKQKLMRCLYVSCMKYERINHHLLLHNTKSQRWKAAKLTILSDHSHTHITHYTVLDAQKKITKPLIFCGTNKINVLIHVRFVLFSLVCFGFSNLSFLPFWHEEKKNHV